MFFWKGVWRVEGARACICFQLAVGGLLPGVCPFPLFPPLACSSRCWKSPRGPWWPQASKTEMRMSGHWVGRSRASSCAVRAFGCCSGGSRALCLSGLTSCLAHRVRAWPWVLHRCRTSLQDRTVQWQEREDTKIVKSLLAFSSSTRLLLLHGVFLPPGRRQTCPQLWTRACTQHVFWWWTEWKNDLGQAFVNLDVTKVIMALTL